MGIPFAIVLPNTAISGFTPKFLCVPLVPILHAQVISSKIKTQLFLFEIFLNSSR